MHLITSTNVKLIKEPFHDEGSSHSLQIHITDFIVILVTCKSEGDAIKNEGARVFTTLYIDFSEAQGQVTP